MTTKATSTESTKVTFEAAYEAFALDPGAPVACRDDFSSVVMFDEGEEIADKAETATAHPDFAAYRVNAAFDDVASKIVEQSYDWVKHSADRHSPQDITDSGKWQHRRRCRNVPSSPPRKSTCLV